MSIDRKLQARRIGAYEQIPKAWARVSVTGIRIFLVLHHEGYALPSYLMSLTLESTLFLVVPLSFSISTITQAFITLKLAGHS
ncbi:hypothetical protein VNO77_35050 [Canavalia gladiata]|uniref:Uncharacterized protein n=1 Tax=Canavalia gladiata TaxID=3824 RepID=A0AAN9KI74_CANGL